MQGWKCLNWKKKKKNEVPEFEKKKKKKMGVSKIGEKNSSIFFRGEETKVPEFGRKKKKNESGWSWKDVNG